MVFPLVIHSSTCAPGWHLLLSSASLSFMVANFLNQNSCIPSWSGVFQFDFFSVALCKSMYISAFGSSSSSNYFVMCLSIRLFCYVLLVAIFLSKIVQLLLHPVVGMISCHLPLFVGRIFFYCFRMSCFVCIVLPLSRYLFNPLSFTSTFWFISSSCIVIFSRVAFSFLFLHITASFLWFTILACFRGFFKSAFLVEFPPPSFWFFLCVFCGDPNFHTN